MGRRIHESQRGRDCVAARWRGCARAKRPASLACHGRCGCSRWRLPCPRSRSVRRAGSHGFGFGVACPAHRGQEAGTVERYGVDQGRTPAERLLCAPMTRFAGRPAMARSGGVHPAHDTRQARQPSCLATGLPFSHAQFVQLLQVQPELGTGAEVVPESECRVKGWPVICVTSSVTNHRGRLGGLLGEDGSRITSAGPCSGRGAGWRRVERSEAVR